LRRILLLAGLAITALPILSDTAEARSSWEEHRRWERHEHREARREAKREERWHRERWREARRHERRYYQHYGPPVAYAPPPPGVMLQLNLR
jgi:hypothetical protein